MIIKTTELEGAALDWAVAKAIKSGSVYIEGGAPVIDVFSEEHGDFFPENYEPSSDWTQGGPLIDKYGIDIWSEPLEMVAEMTVKNSTIVRVGGSTRLVAAMRAIAAAELGETVDVPEELCQ